MEGLEGLTGLRGLRGLRGLTWFRVLAFRHGQFSGFLGSGRAQGSAVGRVALNPKP